MRRKVWLDPARIGEIRRKVKILLRSVGYSAPPTKLESIANFLGISIKYAPYSEGELAGMLLFHPEPIIAINSAHHKNRQRFTIAHEIGHFLLHENEDVHIDERMIVLYRDEHSSLAINEKEVEANQFAAELLMPRGVLLNDLESMPLDVEEDRQVTELAKKYGVSQQAMAFRIANILS